MLHPHKFRNYFRLILGILSLSERLTYFQPRRLSFRFLRFLNLSVFSEVYGLCFFQHKIDIYKACHSVYNMTYDKIKSATIFLESNKSWGKKKCSLLTKPSPRASDTLAYKRKFSPLPLLGISRMSGHLLKSDRDKILVLANLNFYNDHKHRNIASKDQIGFMHDKWVQGGLSKMSKYWSRRVKKESIFLRCWSKFLNFHPSLKLAWSLVHFLLMLEMSHGESDLCRLAGLKVFKQNEQLRSFRVTHQKMTTFSKDSYQVW